MRLKLIRCLNALGDEMKTCSVSCPWLFPFGKLVSTETSRIIPLGTRKAPSRRDTDDRWNFPPAPPAPRAAPWYLQDTAWHWATCHVPSSCHTKHCQPAAARLLPGHGSEGVSGTRGAWFCCCCYGICFVSCSTELWAGPCFASSRARFLSFNQS